MMVHCQNCGSYDIADIFGKCADRCFYEYDGKQYEGYVPTEMGIGGGDHIEFTYCLSCGQIQDNCFPIKQEAIREALEDIE